MYHFHGNADGEEDELEGENIQAFTDSEVEVIKKNLKYIVGKNNTFNVAILLDFITRSKSRRTTWTKKEICYKIYC